MQSAVSGFLLKCLRCEICCAANFSLRVVKIGKLDESLAVEHPVGQFILHRLFGYRAVILCSWKAKVYHHGVSPGSKSPRSNDKDAQGLPSPKRKPLLRTYYEVLVNKEDWPHLHASLHMEHVPFLYDVGDGRGELYLVQGFDHISHDDVIPYTPADGLNVSLDHDLFNVFFNSDPGRDAGYVPSGALSLWAKTIMPSYKFRSVHVETTNDVQVTAIPLYLGRFAYNSNIGSVVARHVRPDHEPDTTDNGGQHWWRYNIRIENLSDVPVTLRYRYWHIYSSPKDNTSDGTRGYFEGKGVIGKEPTLSGLSRAFQYFSQTHLDSDSGRMWGKYTMERQDGSTFSVNIPPFTLDKPPPEDDNDNKPVINL